MKKRQKTKEKKTLQIRIGRLITQEGTGGNCNYILKRSKYRDRVKREKKHKLFCTSKRKRKENIVLQPEVKPLENGKVTKMFRENTIQPICMCGSNYCMLWFLYNRVLYM